MALKGSLEPKVLAVLKERAEPTYEVSYETTVLPYTVAANYISDFTCVRVGSEERVVYLESKGYFSYKDRVKMQNVCEQYPDLDIRMVFQKNNKLSRKAKMTYGEWCDKRDIPWILYEDITLEWLEKDLP